jgi:hypothetical protein
LFHLDHEDPRQVKLFVAINDIDADTGPFMFVAQEDSDAADRHLQYRFEQGSIEDQEFFGVASRSSVRTFVGPAGSGLLVNTSRCYHCGGRANVKERLILQVQYVSLFNCLEPKNAVYRADNLPLSQVQDRFAALAVNSRIGWRGAVKERMVA